MQSPIRQMARRRVPAVIAQMTQYWLTSSTTSQISWIPRYRASALKTVFSRVLWAAVHIYYHRGRSKH